MPYVGKSPVIGNFQKCDSITVVNGQAAYTLQVGGVNVSPQSENHMLVSLNGILQAPVDSFTVSGSTLTFASNLVTGDVIDFVMILGNVLDLGVPSDNTVSLAKLTATGTKDSTTFLRGDNTFASAGGGIEMVQQWRLTSNYTGYVNPIASNWEIVDTDGYGGIGSNMTQSSGIFTFPSTGIYRIDFSAGYYLNGDTRVIPTEIHTTTDNSTYSLASDSPTFIQVTNGSNTYNSSQCTHIFDVTDTSTHKVKFGAGDGSVTTTGNTSATNTSVLFTRLGDT